MDEFGKEKQQVRAAKDVQKFYDPISVWGGGGGGRHCCGTLKKHKSLVFDVIIH